MKELRALIVAPAWVGDMVMASPLIDRVAAGAEVHVLAPAATAPLAQRMASVEQVHTLSVGHGELKLRVRLETARALRKAQFERAYVLPNTAKSALIPWLARIPQRIGYLGEQRYGLVNRRRELHPARTPRLVDRYLALALEPDAAAPNATELPGLLVDHDNLQRLSGAFGLNAERVVCLCPGAEYGLAKRWPSAHYAKVARRCVEAGFEVWLLGSAKDSGVGASIKAAEPRVVDLTGRTSLADAIDLLSVAAGVVTNDSGLMHIAAALQRRVVALFGSTSAAFTPPLAATATVLETDIECRPCFQRTCPLQHQRCLTELVPERVMAELGV